MELALLLVNPAIFIHELLDCWNDALSIINWLKFMFQTFMTKWAPLEFLWNSSGIPAAVGGGYLIWTCEWSNSQGAELGECTQRIAKWTFDLPAESVVGKYFAE